MNRDNRGQGLAEYALVIFVIAMAVIVAVGLLGPQISQLLGEMWLLEGWR